MGIIITAGLTEEANGGGVLQGVLLQLGDVHLGGGGDVGPGVVGHAHLEVVRAQRRPLPDAELTRALVQTEQPERGGRRLVVDFLSVLSP